MLQAMAFLVCDITLSGAFTIELFVNVFAHSNDNFRPFTSVSVPNDVSQDQRNLRPILGAKETYHRSKRDLVKRSILGAPP